MTSLALFAEKIANPFASSMSLLIEKSHNLSVSLSLAARWSMYVAAGVYLLRSELVRRASRPC
jgi:hypothetical protein